MTTSIGNINAFSYGSSFGTSPVASSGKLYVPVNKSSLLYSHFDHVSGVAASSGQMGVSISKIRILNSLIDHLSKIKNEPKQSFTDLNDKQADELIKVYQQQLQQTVKNNSYLIAGAQPQAGALFQIDA